MASSTVSVVAVDVGTSSAKAILYRVGEGVLAEERTVYRTSIPHPGWAEQDADEVFAAVVAGVRRLMDRAKVAPGEVSALVLDGIWHSLLPLDKAGRPLSRALTWSDQRAAPQAAALAAELDVEKVRATTGCSLHPMYGLPRLRWLREEAPELFRQTDRFATIKEYLLGRFFGVRAVDLATASGSGLWNLGTLDWDRELLALSGTTPERFAECVEPTALLPGLVPDVAREMGLAAGTPGVAGASDGAAAHLGAVGMRSDRLSLSVGTSAALRLRVDGPRVTRGSGAWCYYLAEGSWLVGGVLHAGGNLLRWLAVEMLGAKEPGGPLEVDAAVDALLSEAAQAPVGADGLLFLPFLSGERCPVDRADLRGALRGLGFEHGRRHLARALLEGSAFGMYAAYRMLSAGGAPEPVVTGGILRSPIWLSIVADLFGRRLWLPKIPESAAFGSVLMGLKAVGASSSLSQAAELVTTAGQVEPDAERQRAYLPVREAYDRLHDQLLHEPLPAEGRAAQAGPPL